MKKIFNTLFTLFLYIFIQASINTKAYSAENYIIDTKGAHAFIQFKIKHLGYSWLHGRFNSFNGQFTINRNEPQKSHISVEIDTASVDTNHAGRDRHLRGKNFLFVEKYPQAYFKSTELHLNENNKSGILIGNLTLHGITKPISIDFSLIGEGDDPWGGYRMGFEGTTTLTVNDFNIDTASMLGDAFAQIKITLSIEGIKQ